MPPPSGLFGVTDPADVAWLRTMLVGKPDGLARRAVPATQPNGTPAQVRELATGHDCMITMPVELAELLLPLTRTVSDPGLNSDEMSGAYRPVPGPTMDTTA
jgi:hypothetical protein